jgi:hypothetical protein
MEKESRTESSDPDLDKIKSSWRKTLSLFEKKEWSSAVIKAAITIEIAANLVIREELEIARKLDSEFVESLLIWANGIHGKFTRIILPVLKNTERFTAFKKIQEQVFYIDEERNSVVHSGITKQRRTAEKVLGTGREIIETLVREYHAQFELKGLKARQDKKSLPKKRRTFQQCSLFSADTH